MKNINYVEKTLLSNQIEKTNQELISTLYDNEPLVPFVSKLTERYGIDAVEKAMKSILGGE